MEKTMQFLKDCGTFYLATVDEMGAPHVRPFGAVNAFDGKLYLITGKGKPVYAQMKGNPKVEISAMAAGRWIRLSADCVEDDSREAKASMLESNPGLAGMYSPDDDVMAVFYLKNASVQICSFTEAPVSYSF